MSERSVTPCILPLSSQGLSALIFSALALASCGQDGETSNSEGAAQSAQATPVSQALPRALPPVQTAACPDHAEETSEIENAQSFVNPDCWPAGQSGVARDAAIEARVAQLLATMSVQDKVAQVIQADIGSITPAQMAHYQLGSVLNGGNSAPGGDVRAAPEAWLALADEIWSASVGPDGTGIPALWGTDAVHGHNNIIGATIFPHNIGLGAANDPDLIRRIGEITALEVAVTGMDWTFAPTLATPQDDRWGRTYEGYSEDPSIVAAYASAMVEGLQGAPGTDDFLSATRVIATAKHFVGDGGTVNGIDQGDTRASQAAMRDIHAAGYPPAIDAGVQTVMASFNSWHGEKLHGFEVMLTDVLVDRMGFDGFVVGDWNGHGQVDGCAPTSCAQSFNAGVDMFMAPDSWEQLYANTLSQVENGDISMERLDQAVSRILRVKLRLGLFERGLPSSRPLAGQFDRLGNEEHRAVAREAVRKSLVLLKNENQILPIAGGANVLVIGQAASDMSQQTGGWTLSWQGSGNAREHFPNGETILEGIEAAVTGQGGTVQFSSDGRYEIDPDRAPDVAIIVFGEQPYAEFLGDLDNLAFIDPVMAQGNGHLDTLNTLRDQGIPTVAVFISGRPLWMNRELNAADAFIAAWLPGSEGGGLADVLIGDVDGTPRFPVTGTLSYSWPKRPDQAVLNPWDEGYDPLFPLGYGLTYGPTNGSTEPWAPLPEDYAIAQTDAGIVMTEGRPTGEWVLRFLTDDGVRGDITEGAGSAPNGVVSWTHIDRAAQEDAVQITVLGQGASVFIDGPTATDWTRQANGDLMFAVELRVDAASQNGTQNGTGDGALGNAFPETFTGTLGMASTDTPGPFVPLASLETLQPGAWSRIAIPLQCFAQAGVDMASVSRPLVISLTGQASISLSDVRLVQAEPSGECPPLAPSGNEAP